MTRRCLAIAALVAACGPGGIDLGRSDEPVALAMISEGIGDVTLAEGYLVLDDGSRLPAQQVRRGVYALPSRPVRLPNGTDFCAGQPVGYLTLHEAADGTVVMNVGDWPTVPELPDADVLEAEGACATFTFRRG